MASKVYLNNNQFFKPNYHEALEYLIPKFYINDDIETFGKAVDLRDQLINSHIAIASSISSVISIDPVVGTYLSSINTLEGIAPYFVKQNELTKISTQEFNKYILKRVGKNIANFETSAEFSEYLSDTLLPSITLNAPTSYFNQGDAVSASHKYLIENLGWLYFLNTSGATYNPSAFVHDILVSKTFVGQTIDLDDAMKGLSEFIFKNNLSSYIPTSFASGTATYTSGTQQLDKLKTWMEVIYSPLYADRSDFTVRDRFELFIESNSVINKMISNGPFMKLIRSLAFAAFDTNSDAEQIEAFYNIDECPEEYLPFLSDLIGWDLFGSDPSRWRLQLKNAVEVYKRVGTKKGIQFAFNSLYPKDQYRVDIGITELWESYVPFLIYYSLATESSIFKTPQTFNQQIAQGLGIEGYSSSSMDENIKLAVDRILLETYQAFTIKFTPHIPNVSNGFTYRGRRYAIPPFEEYPYYVNIELDQEMVDFITDRLVCFGVREAFALQVRQYLIDNTITPDEEIRTSSWLFFTSGYNEAPNLGDLVVDGDKKFEYASLWNGKSSHFKLILDAADFNFDSEDEYSVSSGLAMQRAAEIVHKFSPAHAIPLINLQLSSVDTATFSEDNLPIINIDKEDPLSLNLQSSGAYINSYKRTYNTTGVSWTREDLLRLMSTATTVTNVPRNTLRRKNYEMVMPKDGYYDHTGFNMPMSWSNDALSGMILGFIPSSLSFQSISSVHNLPAVYSRCQTLNSSASFYGYNVSNTIACMGLYPSSMEYHVDYGQTPPIYILMHKLKEQERYLQVSGDVQTAIALVTQYSPSSEEYQILVGRPWFNVIQSNSNRISNEYSSTFPTSVYDYYNFRFGYDLHALYNIYTKQFERHRLNDGIANLDGPNIFSHIFGSIIRNSDFDLLGASAGALLTTHLSAIQNASISTGLFTVSGGATVASSTNSMYVGVPELRVSSVVDGVELIQTSGVGSNIFRVFKLPSSLKKTYNDLYMFDRTFIQTRSGNGLPRIKVDVKTYTNPSAEGHPLSENFLLPDHKFQFSVNALASNRDGTRLGRSNVGVWIHTKEEGGKSWSYTKDGVWVQHDAILTRSDLLENYSHILSFTPLDREPGRDPSVGYNALNCISFASGLDPGSDPLLTFTKENFKTLNVQFNTNNNVLAPTPEYQKAFGQVHRKDQNYVIEFFMIPNGESNGDFILFDYIDLVDLTMNKLSKYLVSGDPLHHPMRQQFCPELRIDLGREGILTLFSFWNDIAGKNSKPGLASRDSTVTSGTMYTRGGSRADYRDYSSWYGPTKINDMITSLTIRV